MNTKHLELCGGDEWAATVRQHIIPWALEGVALGDDVIEVGPGPGRTTDVLQGLAARLTAVELDGPLAAALGRRLAGSNVAVVNADGTRLPFPDGQFSAALSFTMLHHLPSMALQDALFREVARVLRPGGQFVGIDSLDSEAFRALHVDDICVPVEPARLRDRLAAAGFAVARVDTSPHRLRFQATVAAGAR
jgi:SAM-dependent methyltransferase